MALDTEIDVTPNFTISTLQTDSEIANTLINAVFVTLIIMTLSSIVTKLVLSTRKSTFHYDSWVRSYIFLNSDDILTLFQWIRHRSFISETSWTREKQPLYFSRLCLPVLARVVLFLATIISLVVGIPGQRPLNSCNRGDYDLILPTEVQTSFNDNPLRLGGICRDIPVKSRLGSVESTLSFCQCQRDSELPSDAKKILESLGGAKLLYFNWAKSADRLPTGNLEMLVFEKGQREIGFDWYIDARLPTPQLIDGRETRDFRISFPSPSSNPAIQGNMTNIVKQALPTCRVVTLRAPNEASEEFLFFQLLCDEKNSDILKSVAKTYFNHLTWVKSEATIRKIPVFPTIFGPSREICVTDVVVTRPILNMLPLAIGLVILFLVNILISLWTNRRGNTVDEVFLLVKDALGLDVTSNPLETSKNITIPLRKYRCLHGDRQHLGYFRGVGDQEVDRFVDGEVVSLCSCIERGEARFPELDRNV